MLFKSSLKMRSNRINLLIEGYYLEVISKARYDSRDLEVKDLNLFN